MSAPDGSPVRIEARRCDLVQLMARRGQAATVTEALRCAFGLELPAPGRADTAGDVVALWTQPDGWMLMAPRGAEGELAQRVKAACGELGSVVDQTHGRSVVRVAGERAREVLARICRIDLHPRAFARGQVAVTPVAELPCLVFQPDDVPSFDLVVSSSYAGWFLDAVTHAAASVGYEVPDARSSAEFRAGSL